MAYRYDDIVTVVFTTSQTINLLSPLMIEVPMTINGNNSVINGDGQYAVVFSTMRFDEPYNNLSMYELTIRNGISRQSCAGINTFNTKLQLSNVTISNCTSIIDSGSTVTFGVALSVRNSTLNLNSCTISDCNFSVSGNTNNYAIIYITTLNDLGSLSYINGCTINNNIYDNTDSSKYSVILNEGQSRVQITDTLFSNNGGAISIINGSSVVMKHNTITGCSASNNGGDNIYWWK
jgi:hypothetical protein